ncbi:uncharacterized protein [Miscanthus floridulus]|uniref:uncharacterized protein n=1 Tax=Miscanthus floridulus TaxID=154761 RepID=UPI00345A69D2
MGSSLPPSSVAVLTTAAHEHRHHPCSPDDDFEFTPLLHRPRRRRINARTTERPRTVVVQVAATTVVAEPQPPQRARRGAPSIAAAAAPAPPRKPQQVRWHDMAFGSVRVPAAMDMGEIRRRLRLRARQQALAGGAGNEQPSSAAAGWAPWRLIRSLSCKGVEAVAAAAAPVRLV